MLTFLEGKYFINSPLLTMVGERLDGAIEMLRKEILIGGEELVIFLSEKSKNNDFEGFKVEINDIKPVDGFYKSITNKRFEILDGILQKEYIIESYKQRNGDKIEIDNYRMQKSKIGRRVWINEKTAPNGKYVTGAISVIFVKDGKTTDK